jgi:hypothetical protein
MVLLRGNLRESAVKVGLVVVVVVRWWWQRRRLLICSDGFLCVVAVSIAVLQRPLLTCLMFIFRRGARPRLRYVESQLFVEPLVLVRNGSIRLPLELPLEIPLELPLELPLVGRLVGRLPGRLLGWGR